MTNPLEYRIYVKRAASQKGSMRLHQTTYNEQEARRITADLAFSGQWVKVIIKEDDFPKDRWD